MKRKNISHGCHTILTQPREKLILPVIGVVVWLSVTISLAFSFYTNDITAMAAWEIAVHFVFFPVLSLAPWLYLFRTLEYAVLSEKGITVKFLWFTVQTHTWEDIVSVKRERLKVFLNGGDDFWLVLRTAAARKDAPTGAVNRFRGAYCLIFDSKKNEEIIRTCMALYMPQIKPRKNKRGKIIKTEAKDYPEITRLPENFRGSKECSFKVATQSREILLFQKVLALVFFVLFVFCLWIALYSAGKMFFTVSFASLFLFFYLVSRIKEGRAEVAEFSENGITIRRSSQVIVTKPWSEITGYMKQDVDGNELSLIGASIRRSEWIFFLTKNPRETTAKCGVNRSEGVAIHIAATKENCAFTEKYFSGRPVDSIK